MKKVLGILMVGVLLSACNSSMPTVPEDVYTSYKVVVGKVWRKKTVKFQTVYMHDKILSDIATALTRSNNVGKVVEKLEEKQLPPAPKVTAYEYVIKTKSGKYEAVIYTENKFVVGDEVYAVLSDVPEIFYLNDK